MSGEANNPNPSTAAAASNSDAVGSDEVNTTNSGPTSSSSAESAFRQNAATLHLHQHQHQPPPPPPTGTYTAPIDDAGGKPSTLDSRYAPIYHPYYPPPPHATGHYSAALSQAGPYSAAMAQHARHPPPGQGQPPPQPLPVAGSHLSSPRPSYDREDPQQYHRPIPVRAHPNESDYRGHPPPPHPPPPPGYAGHPPHPYQAYSKPLSSQSFPPPVYHYPVYPANRLEDSNKARIRGHQPPPPSETYSDVDGHGREGATSPSQIEMSHRDEVTNMGCTCKKTKCLKLYCQCFAAQLVCGPNCRCLVCFNTTKHEQARKDAMRAILTRNPAAFDTKFSKTKERKSKEQQLVLAHKLGCKCRRSACMKKYCECYAGNVKCSSNCRCVGCKNTSSSNNFGPGKPDASLPLRDGGMGGYELPMSQQHGARTGREPWMMNAAQNLAFLKHGSPTVEKATAQLQHETGEVASMPSLAASSSDTSPEEKVEEAPKQPTENESDPNGSTVNSLLMAAMAMTEFQSRKEPKARSKNDESVAEKEQVSQPLHSERPELRKVFRPSPKRKTVDRAEDDSTMSAGTNSQVEECVAQKDSSSTSVHCADHVRPTTMESSDSVEVRSPSDPQSRDLHDPRDLKRTRLGSVRKRILVKEEDNGKAPSSSDDLPKEKTSNLETPNQKASAGPDILTPVSARCIDFKKIHLSSSSPLTSTKENESAS